MTADKLRAVLFDWRGTLVTTLTPEEWVREALLRLGRSTANEKVGHLLGRIEAAAGEPDRLDAPTVDTDLAVHRDTYFGVFADAGLDADLADALYTVESDPVHNRFAVDVAPTLRAISAHQMKVAVVSDIHFDVRPVFAAEGLAELVDAFVLSYEHGVQKPDPAIFEAALAALGTTASETLMVGDRQVPDGGALDVGITTLLLPPLTDRRQRRLHRVTSLLDV